MDFLDLAKKRYTTKKYDSSKKITNGHIEQLKEILRLSPSSIDSQPWEFIFVSDPAIKKELAAASLFNQHKVEDASHVVVFNSIDSIQKFEEQIQKNLPEGSIAYYNNVIKPLPEADRKKWFQHQVYLSLGFFLAACASMEIDSTPMEGIKTDEYRKILKLDDYEPLFAVAIGYRDFGDQNQPSITPKLRLNLNQVTKSI